MTDIVEAKQIFRQAAKLTTADIPRAVMAKVFEDVNSNVDEGEEVDNESAKRFILASILSVQLSFVLIVLSYMSSWKQ